MSLIDAHLHLWDPQIRPYSWCAGIPELNQAFTMNDYLAAGAGLGIGKALFVECDVDEPHALEEATAVQTLSQEYPLIAGMVASCRPEREDFPAQLERLLELPLLRGVRRVLHVMPDELSTGPLFSSNLNLLAKHGLTFDLCVLARQLPLAACLVRRCPAVQFILDHCGVPDIKNAAWDPWRTDLRAMASLPNVICKVSGISTQALPAWTTGDLKPWVDHVVDCFGFDRLVWGGDWPVCTLNGSLGSLVETTREIFSSASESEQEKLYCRNAERIYHL